MKIFVGQAVTGESIEDLKKECSEIQGILETEGNKGYCTVFDDELQKNKYNFILKHAFEKIDESDIFLALVRSDKRSEGMLMEIGYCLSKNKRIILAIKKGVDSSLREVAEKIIEFDDFEDLKNKLRGIK